MWVWGGHLGDVWGHSMGLRGNSGVSAVGQSTREQGHRGHPGQCCSRGTGMYPQQHPAPPGCPCTVGWPGGTKAEPDPPPPPVSPPSPPAPAYCCNALDGRWYSYDDSRVEGVREAEVSTRSAYILFYQRRNAAPAWAAGSSLRGEHPPPCPPAPHSTRKP